MNREFLEKALRLGAYALGGAALASVIVGLLMLHIPQLIGRSLAYGAGVILLLYGVGTVANLIWTWIKTRRQDR